MVTSPRLRWLSFVVQRDHCVSAVPHILAKLYGLLDAFEADAPEFTDDESAGLGLKSRAPPRSTAPSGITRPAVR